MLLLGVLAAQAEGAVAGGPAYDLLETEILTGSQASVTFSSLNSTYGADYQHLQIRAVARNDQNNGIGTNYVQFNGVTTNSYATHRLLGNGSTVTSSGTTSTNSITVGFAPFANQTTGAFGVGVIDILDPFETTKNTTVRALGGVPGGVDSQVALQSGVWLNTDAVTSILIKPFFSYIAGTRISLYGLKASA